MSMSYTYEEKQAARQKVYKAVKSGDLLKPDSCSKCGSFANIQGHHPDYSKPLVVEWLCYLCHKKIHLALGSFSIRNKRKPLRMTMKEVLNRSSLASKDMQIRKN